MSSHTTQYFGWATTGSSDAHTLDAIGSSYTRFPGSTVADLMTAIRHKTTVAIKGYWPITALANYGYHALRDNIYQIYHAKRHLISNPR